jgi:hypothetical protein
MTRKRSPTSSADARATRARRMDVNRRVVCGFGSTGRSPALGTMRMRGLLRSRLVFQALFQERRNARSPSNATLTGVATAVPSRL